MGQAAPPKTLATFDGSSLKWVRVAEPEFARRHLNLDHYAVIIEERGDTVVVLLHSVNSIEGAKGSSVTYPDFDMEISKKTMRIVRANFDR